MTTIKTTTANLPVSADVLYGFLADLSKHRAFLEPAAQGFKGEADNYTYVIEIMGTRLRQDMAVKTRVPGQLVSLVTGAKKLFEHELRFEISASGAGCTLQLVDEADIPTMMAMMGAEKLLKGQLEYALKNIQDLAAAGKIA
jgi:carbon monoxide dehydrogenase subunit G